MPQKNSGQTGGDILPKISGIVLAGGASRRMGGHNKALLKIGAGTIVERAVGILRSIFQEVLIITNTPEEFKFLGLPMFKDLKPGQGSLGGLYTGLKVCSGDYAFLTACDMPFLSRRAILHMVSLVEDYDVIIPKFSDHWEPLHAIYSPRCLPHIETLLAAGDLKIVNFFHQVNVREVPEKDLRLFDQELTFTINLNTPDDLARARLLAEKVDPTRYPSD